MPTNTIKPRQLERIHRTRKKYGQDCYVKWGKSSGGSPILRLWKQGKLVKRK